MILPSRTRYATTCFNFGSSHSAVYTSKRFSATSENVDTIKPPNERRVPVWAMRLPEGGVVVSEGAGEG